MAKMTRAQLDKQLDKFVVKRTCAQLSRDFTHAQRQMAGIKATLAKESAVIARLVHQRKTSSWRRHTFQRATAALEARIKRHDAASTAFFKVNNEVVSLRAMLKHRDCKTSGLGAGVATRCPANVGSQRAPAHLRTVRR